jgi:aminoglycoside 6-adenylyltransferase
MDTSAADYERLVGRIVAYALTDDNLRAAGIVGSRARQDHPADEWSDLDVLLVANNPQFYCASGDWLHAIGTPWLTHLEPTADGSRVERRVLFEGGLDVDFIPCSIGDVRAMAEHGFPPEVADMLCKGLRFLVDKDDLSSALAGIPWAPSRLRLPSEEEFLNAVNDFWYHAVWTGKHLRRGELWWGKSACDDYLKQLLRQMLEWHAIASRGEEAKVWEHGRFLEEWADNRALEVLPHVFSHYDEEDIWRALRETMVLFRWVELETAARLRYSYPGLGEQRARELLDSIASARGRSLCIPG